LQAGTQVPAFFFAPGLELDERHIRAIWNQNFAGQPRKKCRLKDLTTNVLTIP
jgi:hypothetical protein